MKKFLIKKRLSKEDKENSILFGLIDLYIKTNLPVGSNYLRENGFKHMSSATIRNYFSELEKKGFLTQPHTSGGRIPTCKAYKDYIDFYLQNISIDKKDEKLFKETLDIQSKKITDFLNGSLEKLSDIINLSVFQSSPRFDQDFISNIKLLVLDKNKVLCVIVTDFGLIKTETLFSNHDLTDEITKKIEDFFLWRMNKIEKPIIEDQKIFKLAQHLYNELMVRYVVGYANFSFEDISKSGLSKLLKYPEFKDPAILAEGLSIFENSFQLHEVLKSTLNKNDLTCFIGDDLKEFGFKIKNVAIIGIPYAIANIPVGVVGILCPIRSPYKKLFSILKSYSKYLSESLTKNIYKYKITFRKTSDFKITDKSILLEDKSR